VIEVRQRAIQGDTSFVVFGSDFDDQGTSALRGGARVDHLYGGAGSDELYGYGDDDLLEGGSGSDRMYAGDGKDKLYGGAGEDTLDGGLQYDLLEGGAGLDKYALWSADSATDTIFDSDNSGRLLVDGTEITSFRPIGYSFYESGDGRYQLTLLPDGSGTQTANLYRKDTGQQLAEIVRVPMGTNVLGYGLTPPPAPVPTNSYVRANENDVFRVWYLQNSGTSNLASGTGLADGGNGNDYVEGGTFASMEMRGGAGNDVLRDLRLSTPSAESGQTVTLSGGIGSDYLYGAGGTMYLDGGDGNDFISSARYDSAPDFALLAGGVPTISYVPSLLADLGSLLSLTPALASGTEGTYDAALGRWQFAYRPIAAGTSNAGNALLAEAGGPYGLTATGFNGGSVQQVGPSSLYPGVPAISQYRTTLTTAPGDPFAAVNITFTRSDGTNVSGQLVHTWLFDANGKNQNGTSLSTMALDGSTSGTEFAFITAGTGDDVVFGGAGRDSVDAGTGNDRVDGAGGEDFILGGAGNDFLVGGRYNDSLIGGDDNDTLHGGGENDDLYGDAGNDVLYGDMFTATYAADGAYLTYQELEPAGTDLLNAGSGDDYLSGGGGDDLLIGGTGNDTLFGSLGNDTLVGDGFVSVNPATDGGIDVMAGDAGDDIYYVNVVGDIVNERASEGSDTIRSEISYTLGANLENLELLTAFSLAGTGNSLNNRLVGNGSGNLLDGGAGDDIIEGGGGEDRLIGGLGTDVLRGGDDNDTYVIDSLDDTIEEANWVFGGNDTVEASISYTLGANVENILLTSTGNFSATGNELSNRLIGNSGNNLLIGLAGDDSLDGGAGADRMEGGAGNDAYYVDNSSDVVVDLPGEGTDTVITSLSWGLGADTENITYTESGSATIAGNTLSNLLTFTRSVAYSTAAVQTLGASAYGGAGDDTYVFTPSYSYQLSNDTARLYALTENSGEGYDALKVNGPSVRLPDNFEALIISPFSIAGITYVPTEGMSSAKPKYFGNSSDNLIDISAAVGISTPTNILLEQVGGFEIDGGAGADRMIGTSMNDVYYVDDIGDAVVESSASAQSVDRVVSSVSFTLGTNVENLDLVGTGQLNGTGNALANKLTGNASANLLQGSAGNDFYLGGAGNDTIVDSAGDETYRVEVGHGFDTITDSSGTDRVEFGAGILPSDITVGERNGALVIEIGRGFDGVAIQGMVNVDGSLNAANAIEQVVFSNATVWTAADLISRMSRGVRTLTGTASAETLRGAAGDDSLTALAGNDILVGGYGADTMRGGTGDDMYAVDSASDLVIESAGEGYDTVESSAGGVIPGNVEKLRLMGLANLDATGSNHADWIEGNAGVNVILGLGGNDVIYGGDGDDVLRGGSGDDQTYDTAGFNTYLYGRGDGNDYIQMYGRILFDAGILPADIDLVKVVGTYELRLGGGDLISTPYAMRLDFADGSTWSQQDFAARARVIGTDWNDVYTGTVGDDTFDGLGGDDSIDGLGGNDTLSGGSGNDWIGGRAGNDVLSGGDGDDQINGEDGDDTITGGAGYDLLLGGAGNDSINSGPGAPGASPDLLTGGLGDDLLTGSGSGEYFTFKKGDGNDTIVTHAATGAASGVLDFYDIYGTTTSIFPGNVTLSRGTGANVDDMLVKINGGADGQITIKNQFLVTGGNRADGISWIRFSDYSYWSRANMDANTPGGPAVPTEGSDVLRGTTANDTVDALGGDDTVYGDAGDDTLLGGNGNDRLYGELGNDILNGGAGADTLVGGPGNDAYTVDSTSDVVTELTAEGTDTVNASVSFTLGGDVENLTLTLFSAINGTGNALANTLRGNDAANRLDGGAGADSMIGQAGDDTYVVDNVGDTVVEGAGMGTDTVESSITYTLPSNVENLTLTGTAAINTAGNTLANTLRGNVAANTLSGGTGADTMIGGAGNDTYIVDNTGDIVTEFASEGTDTIQSSVTHTLAANVENLTLTGTSTINGTGNALANSLTGNSGANRLDGGAGTDTMTGGTGNDTYVVDNAGDVVVEAASGGTDIVEASVTYTLGAEIENLTLTGTAAINGTGNTLNNTITGNSAANMLTGGAGGDTLNGGTGVDTLIGGAGNDTYVVDVLGDVVTELASEGTDTVQTALTYTLGANLENLTLTGGAAVNGTGNDLANVITGNSANNILTGGLGNDTLNGGAGIDTLIGGLGNDTYVVDVAGDVITELAGEGTDTVQSAITYVLGATLENLTLTGTAAIKATGNDAANTLTGNSAANVLTGGLGNDTLNGGAGADTLIGGLGNDTYVVDNVGDVITEVAGEGTDTVQSSITYVLGATLENLTLTGSTVINGTGNDANNTLTGNSAANVLTGGLGNDSLNGGAGADTLIGGAGNDNYTVDNTGDVTTELAGEGTDLVNASITWTLGANVENLTLTGSSAINGTGNALDNTLTGNSAANVLTGGAGNDALNGAAGADTMIGGTGNDTYTVDNTGDITTELAGEGTDSVSSSVTYMLAGNVENLTLTGSAVINGTGNDLANVITGNTAANVLSGGLGKDTLTDSAGANVYVGGAGNDMLNVTSSGIDRIAMARGHGVDTVVGSGTAANDVLEVSNGITKAAMGLIKSGNDLVLDLGSGESVTLRNWYAGVRNIGTLKIIGDATWVPGQTGTPTVVETLNLVTVASQFDAARAADPLLTRWPLSSASTTLVARTIAFSDEEPVLSPAPAPRLTSPRIGSKSALLTSRLEPSDAVLESHSLRNLRALQRLWAPNEAPSKAASWLPAAAETTQSPEAAQFAADDVTFEPVADLPPAKESPTVENPWVDDGSGEIVICDDEPVTGAEFEPVRQTPQGDGTPWWHDPTMTQLIAPHVKHSATVTGWNTVADLLAASSDTATESTLSAPLADLVLVVPQTTVPMDALTRPSTGVVSEWERRSAFR
jgi:Ca2+-binding RTX toxin-like protein